VTLPPPGELEIIAHRGYSARAPENTLASMDRAIAAGADAVEWDVHLTADGTPVVIHDDTLQRTSDGRGRVRDHTLEQLRALDFGGWFGREFAGERIPTLAEALERTRGRVRVYCEIKQGADTDEVDRIFDLVRDADRVGDVVFISFDWQTLARIHARDAEASTGFILDDRRLFDDALERAAADPRALLDLDAGLVLREPALGRRALERGVPLAVWTVNRADQATRLRAAGVTRFTTNEVETLLSWRAAGAGAGTA
jgi:glycerophosphoryl diester phosphodiesterase